jgi:hypothetical protein
MKIGNQEVEQAAKCDHCARLKSTRTNSRKHCAVRETDNAAKIMNIGS